MSTPTLKTVKAQQVNVKEYEHHIILAVLCYVKVLLRYVGNIYILHRTGYGNNTCMTIRNREGILDTVTLNSRLVCLNYNTCRAGMLAQL